MRNEITFGLSIIALVIGGLSLYEGWGRLSQVLIFTAAGLALARYLPRWSRQIGQKSGTPMRPEVVQPSRLITALSWLSCAFALASIVLNFRNL
jgi:hypothetical protein